MKVVVLFDQMDEFGCDLNGLKQELGRLSSIRFPLSPS
jgi:hypothetical protein